MKITTKTLRAKRACENQVLSFEKEWGEDAEVTLPNLLRAVELGLDIDWFASNCLPIPIWARYRIEITAISNRCKAEVDVIWKRYKVKIAPLEHRFYAEIKPIRERCKAELATIWEHCDLTVKDAEVAAIWKRYWAEVATIRKHYKIKRDPIWERYRIKINFVEERCDAEKAATIANLIKGGIE